MRGNEINGLGIFGKMRLIDESQGNQRLTHLCKIWPI